MPLHLPGDVLHAGNAREVGVLGPQDGPEGESYASHFLSTANGPSGIIGQATEAGMKRDYIEQRDGGYWITGSRVSLDSLVYAFLRGASPEAIARSFPLVTLEDVFGAITFYLAHQPEVDAHLRQSESEFDALREKARQANPLLFKKLEEARRQTQASRP